MIVTLALRNLAHDKVGLLETLGRRLRRVGFLSHANSSGGDDEPEILRSSSR